MTCMVFSPQSERVVFHCDNVVCKSWAVKQVCVGGVGGCGLADIFLCITASYIMFSIFLQTFNILVPKGRLFRHMNLSLSKLNNKVEFHSSKEHAAFDLLWQKNTLNSG